MSIIPKSPIGDKLSVVENFLCFKPFADPATLPTHEQKLQALAATLPEAEWVDAPYCYLTGRLWERTRAFAITSAGLERLTMDRSETFLIETDRLDDGHLFEHLACKFQTDLEDLKNALGMARRLHGIVLDSSETRATDQMLKASEAARLAFGNGREAFGIPRKRASLWARPRSA